jgi:hypothetical protein
VVAGFLPTEDIIASIPEIFELNGDNAEAVEKECEAITHRAVEEHLRAQASWGTAPTDNDRLIEAFNDMEENGIVAREHWTCCQNCGHTEIGAEIEFAEEFGPVIGYTFYHQQDTDAAVEGGGIMLAYGSTSEGNELEVPKKVVEILQKHGFLVEWDGSTSKRISIPQFEWRRRNQLIRA